MRKSFTFTIILLALAACTVPQIQNPEPASTSTPQVNMLNPTVIAAATETGTGSPGGNASGGYLPPGNSEALSDWWGIIKSTPPGAQYDNYFERQDLGQILCFGIDSMDPAVKSQIESLRDSGKIVHLYGTLLSNVPDYNGSQILVDRVEIEE